MTDLFSGLGPQPVDNSPFSTLAPTDNTETPPPAPAPDRQARVAALANAPTDVPLSDLMNQMSQLTQGYGNLIKREGDYNIRLQAAAKQQSSEIDGLSRLTNQDQAGTDAINSAMISTIQHGIDQRKESALEASAVQRVRDLSAAGNPTEAALLARNLMAGDTEQVRSDIAVKKMILQRELENAQLAHDNQGWIAHLGDFVMGDIVPVHRSFQAGDVFDVDKSQQHWYDWVFSGERRRAQADSLWNLAPDDFAKVVREQVIPQITKSSTFLGYRNRSDELNTISGLVSTPTVVEQNFNDALTNFGWVGPAEAKGVAKLPELLASIGARKASQELVTDAVVKTITEGTDASLAKTGITLDQATDHSLPTFVNPVENKTTKFVSALGYNVERDKAIASGKDWGVNSVDGGYEFHGGHLNETVPIAADVSSNVAKAKGLMDFLQSNNFLSTTRFTTDAEKSETIQAQVKALNEEFGGPLKNVESTNVPLAGGRSTTDMTMTIGQDGDGGFGTHDEALNKAASFGYPNAEVIQDTSGQWFAKITRTMPETGAYTNTLTPKSTFGLSRWLLGNRDIGDTAVADMAQAGSNKRASLMKQIIPEFAKKFEPLRKQERLDLSQIWAAGENQGVWLNRDQFEASYKKAFNREAKPREWDAYQAGREIHDIDYHLRNDDAYLQRAIKGYETGSFDTPLGRVDGQNVKVNRDLTHQPITAVMDTSTGQVIKPEEMTDALRETRKAAGYMQVTTEQPIKFGDGTYLQEFLVKTDQTTLEPLSREQIGYRAGGHRIYDATHFVKQAERVVQKYTGETLLLSPNVLIAGTKAETEVYAQTLEALREAAKAGRSAGDLDTIINGRAGYPTGAEFLDAADKKLINLDHPFESVKDRELPTEYFKNANSGFVNLADKDEGGSQGLMRTQGRMYTSSKGEHLTDWRGNLAPTLDMFKTMDTALNNIVSITSFNDFKTSAMARWAKTFDNALEQHPADWSPEKIFRDGKVRTTNISSIVRNQALGQREVVQRVMGWETEADRVANEVSERLQNWVMGDDPESFRHNAGKAVVNWFEDKNPVRGAKTFASDLKLGLFNIAQFPTQLSTMIAAITIEPELGFQGMMAAVPLRFHLMSEVSGDAGLDMFVKRGAHTAAGFKDPAEFKAFMNSAKKSGFFEVGQLHTYMNGRPFHTATSALGGKVSQARDVSRFFFTEPEVWNRMTAWRIGWGTVRKEFPELAVGGDEFMLKVQGQAEKFSFNMSEHSAAAWQRGLLGVPTQFWAYNARVAELMFGNTLNASQKWRLIIGQSLLYGSAGVPGVGLLSDLYKQKHADQLDKTGLNSVYGLFDRGLVDEMYYHTFNVDNQIGRKLGSGNWPTDTIKDIFGVGSYGEKSFGEMLGGASGSILWDGSKTLFDVIRHSTAETGGEQINPILRDDVMHLASNMSTFSNATKAYMINKYGTLVTAKGTVFASDVPKSDAFAQLLGFAPGKADQVSTMMAYHKNEQNQLHDAEQLILKYRQLMVAEPENRERLANELSVGMKMFPEDVRMRAIKSAHAHTSPSLYDQLNSQIQKHKATEDMIKQQAGKQ